MSEFDITLKEALKLAYDKKWDEFEQETANEPDYVFPEGYDERVLNKCYKVLDTGNYGRTIVDSSAIEFHSRPRIRRALLVAALIAVMLIGSITAYALTHPEIIYNIKKTITEWTFHFQQTDPEAAEKEFVPLKPETPEGFEIIYEEVVPSLSYDIQYEDIDGHNIIYSQYEIESLELKISGEGEEYTDIEINGSTGQAYHQVNDWSIVWDNGYYVFRITGNCELEMLIEMAESVE